MSAAAERTVYTPEDLLRMPDGAHYELVNGQLVERHGGGLAGWVGGQIAARAGIADPGHQIGWGFSAGCGYQCFPGEPSRVRSPGYSFIRRGRLSGERIPDGHILIHPDLAVEVVSPNDRFYEVVAKAEEYRAAGVPLVWVINPRTRTVYVYRLDGSVTHLREEDELTAEDLLPEFRCLVAELFPPQEISG